MGMGQASTRPGPLRRLWRRVTGGLSETIGSEQTFDYLWYDDDLFRIQPTLDARRGDYAFWDRARKGHVKGLHLAGAFLKPLESKVSAWVLGATPKFSSENKELPGLVNDWWIKNQAEIMHGYRESVGLGDSYLVFNGDGTLTVLPPHIVKPIVDEQNYSKTIGYRVVERFSHPENVGKTQTVINEYYADYRIEKIVGGGGQIVGQPRRYINPMGVLQVVKIPNAATAGELYGRPEGEGVLSVLWAYDRVLQAGINGNIRQGRPTPTMEGVPPDQIAKLIDLFGKEIKYKDEKGVERTRKEIVFDADNFFMTPGTFKYAQPGSFAGDTEKLLGLLFYLILQHTEIPEFVWGNAIASSKASAESQMGPFSKFIEGKQTSINHWVSHLLQLVVAWYATFEFSVSGTDAVSIQYAPLTNADGKLTLDAIALGRKEMLLDRETALRLMPLDIDDPQEVLAQIDKEVAAEREAIESARTAQAERDAGFVPPEAQGDTLSIADEMRLLEAVRLPEVVHTGAMAAFFLPGREAEQLYGIASVGLDGNAQITTPDEMHLTLSYMGDVADVSRANAERALEQFAAMHMKLEGEISGMGRFSNTHMDGYDAIYASFDSPDLAAFRQNLVRTLMENGVNTNMNHGFTPHITLAYIEDDAPTPDLRIPPMPVRFEAITLAWGNERLTYSLIDGAEPELAAAS